MAQRHHQDQGQDREEEDDERQGEDEVQHDLLHVHRDHEAVTVREHQQGQE